ncbi:YlbL family protein [Georgenia ruanii]|uniref:YlbL family protein n=1 Tax=Georgenia ruanii TaxID=348442 RepID=UPI001D0349D3|nr:S16 family serine protease [Georgenia ruanii]
MILPGRRTADRRGPDILPAGGATPHGVGPAPESVEDAPLVSRRSVTLVVAGALLAVLILVAVVVPLPYAIERPGPTVNTLSEVDGKPLITVDGAPTYPTSGELRLTTVSVSGGPGYPVTAADVVAGWLSSDEVVLPREALFPAGSTRQSVDEQAGAQMTSSQTNATVAALEELGHKVPMVLTVQEAAKGSGAQGILLAGDVITSIQPAGGPRTDVQTFSDLAHVLAATAPGTTVAVGIRRDGQARTVDVPTMALPVDRSTADGAAPHEGSILGVVLKPDVQLPIDVHFDIDKIGGPSAGTMFALGIIDVLTPGEMTGGKDIAGTGTMNLAGEVGAIGGIQQKLVAARRDGAEWFLAPRANCGEVRGHVPDGLHVVSVATLAEAHKAVEEIGAGDGASLPTCAG